MVFALPIDISGLVLDWAVNHVPVITGAVVFILFAVWFGGWISGYATRFRHVEADVAVLKDGMTGVNKQLGKIKKNFKVLETRMDGFEKRMDGLEKRMDSFDTRFDLLDNKIDSKFNSLDQKFTALLTQLSVRNGKAED